MDASPTDDQSYQPDVVEKIERVMNVPGAKTLFLMFGLLCGMMGIIFIYVVLQYQGGLPIQIDCSTALRTCAAIP